MSSLAWLNKGLLFNTLREANLKRMPEFKNAKGEYAHKRADGSDWSLGDWVTALVGEVGEAANLIKKVARGDMTLDTVLKTNPDNTKVTVRDELAHELADVQTYLDILAFQARIDLGQATIRKFNIVSARVGSDIRIRPDGSDWAYGYDAETTPQFAPGFDVPRACRLKSAKESDARAWQAVQYTGSNFEDVKKFCGPDEAEVRYVGEPGQQSIWIARERHLADPDHEGQYRKLRRGEFVLKESNGSLSIKSDEFFAMFFEAVP